METENDLLKTSLVLANTTSQLREERFCVKKSGGIIFIPTTEICFCKAYGYVSKIINKEQTTFTIPKTLGSMEEKLKNYNFVRCHRSYLVNILYIKEIVGCRNKTIILTNDEKIPCSRGNYRNLKNLIIYGRINK